MKPRVAKRERPRAIISHQIPVSVSGGRQGLKGVAGVTGRGSPCRSVPHVTLHLPGLEVDIIGKHRSMIGAWDRGRPPRAEKGKKGEFHSLTVGQKGRENYSPGVGLGAFNLLEIGGFGPVGSRGRQ